MSDLQKSKPKLSAPIAAGAGLAVLLFAIGFASLGNFGKRQQLRTVGEDLQKLEAAFKAYKEKNGSYPNNVDTGVTPEGMEQFSSYFENPTPVGGKYDWEGPNTWGFAAISVQKPDLGIGALVDLDQAIDDGKLYTGKLRVIDNRYFWVIEEKS